MTAVHDVVNRLFTLAATTLPAWQVLDGWNGKTDLQRKALILAFSPTVGTESITSTVDEDDGGLCALVETITVACTGSIWDGDLEFTGKRGELSDMLSALHDALADDQKLGGIAFDTWLAPAARWYTDVASATRDAPARATVQVDFTIRVRVHAE